jgi:hypothetical protein
MAEQKPQQKVPNEIQGFPEPGHGKTGAVKALGDLSLIPVPKFVRVPITFASRYDRDPTRDTEIGGIPVKPRTPSQTESELGAVLREHSKELLADSPADLTEGTVADILANKMKSSGPSFG